MRAVAYARFSSDKQREESIIAQLRAIHRYANSQGIEIIKEYTDEGKSASTDDRPAFQQMFLEIVQYKPDFVLVHKLDRFARDRFDSIFYRREIQKVGAKLIAVDQPMDDSPEAGLQEGMLELLAEYYIRNLAREVMKGMKENAYKAKYNGGWIPLGYDINPDGHYIINDDEAKTVRIIFSRLLQGNSYGYIIGELNRQGRKTKRGKEFGKNSLYELLKNEKYCGTYVFNETPKRLNGKRNNRVKKSDTEIIRQENAIPAIVSREDWNQVQEVMNERKIGPREKVDNVVYILTGVLKCGHCGAAMVGNGSTKMVNGERKRYYYYQCNNAMRTQSCNNKKRYPKGKIENAVLTQIEKGVVRPNNIEELANTLWADIKIINDSRDEEKVGFEKQLQDVEGKINHIINAIEKGMNPGDFIQRMNELREQKQYLTGKLSERKSPFEGITKQDILLFLKRQRGKLILRENLEVCKNIVASYIDKATLLEGNLDITFKFNLMSCDKTGVGGGT